MRTRWHPTDVGMRSKSILKKALLLALLLQPLVPVWATSTLMDPLLSVGQAGAYPKSRQIGTGNNLFPTDGGALGTYSIQTWTQSAQTAIVTLTSTASTVQLVSNAGATYAITLPAASGNGAKVLAFKKTDNNTNQITITPAGSDTIDGAASYALTAQNQYIVLQSDGTSVWRVIATNNAGDLLGTLSNSRLATSVATSSGNLSPLFTSTVTANAIVYTLSTGTNPSWFGCSGSTTPAYQTGLIPVALVPLVDVPWSTKSSSFSAVADNQYIVTATATCTLPTAVGASGQRILVIWNASSGTLTFNTTSSQTMSGIASGALTTTVQYDTYEFVSDGSNWFLR